MNHIREATEADNAALIELAKACPMRASISLCIERAPDFFALCRARGHGKVWVATQSIHEGARILGCIDAAQREVFVDGTPTAVSYVCDLKVVSDARGRGLGRALSEHAIRMCRGARIVGTQAEGNNAMARVFASLSEPSHLLARMVALQLLPVRIPHTSPQYTVRRVPIGDEHRHFYARCAAKTSLQATSILRASHAYVAERDGHLHALCTVHDARNEKRTRLVRLPIVMRSMLALINLVTSAKLPKQGEFLEHLTIRHLVADDNSPDAAASLCGAVLRELRTHLPGAQFALLVLDARDRLLPELRRFLKFQYRYQLIGNFEPTASALYADDPSLS